MLKRATTLGTLALGVAVVLTTSSTAAEQRAHAFTIRSSLDGKTVLPQRVRWIAYPSAPVLFPGVEFLIDGKVVFDNRLPPYAFGADGRDESTGKVNTGYLVTSWLTPGKHTFTVRARGQGANRNKTATHSVVARVLQRKAPPAQLVGTWQRELTAAVPPDRRVLFRSITVQPGTYRITFDRRFIRITGSAAPGNAKIDFDANAGTLTLYGPVWTSESEGAICEPWGPKSTYSWSVSEGVLTLAPASQADACKQRGALISGDWTRVK
jgi:hypothetical protein